MIASDAAEGSEPPDYALLDQAGLGGGMFYPRPNDSGPPSGATDHRIPTSYGTGPAAEADAILGARFYLADPAYPTVLYFHGNGEVASDHDGIAPMYHAIGLNLLVADFRGYGDSTGTPTYAALVGDAHPVVAYFHDTLDGLRCAEARYVMGRSLGANPALEVAANAAARFRGLVIESGAGNIRRSLVRTGLIDTELGARLARAHEQKLASIALPTLLIHGEADTLVPLATAETLRDLLTGTTVQLEVIARAGHNDILWLGRDRYFEVIADLVRRTA